jgi:hypothetical protein
MEGIEMRRPVAASRGAGRRGWECRMSAVTNEILCVGRFTPATSYQRFAYACAALLLASGVFHGFVFLIDGGSWEGPVSWRKPIVFGLSFGITLLTVSWIVGLMRLRNVTGWIVMGVLSVASVLEVFLITMQRWRGVPSHFNESTPFNATVFSLMGALVTFVALTLVFVTVRSFWPIDAPASLAWAIRLGLVLLLVSQEVGVQMIAEGSNTFGAAGALKVPHAFTLHALQVLPALALLLVIAEFTESQRLELVALASIGYGLLIGSTMAQAYAGLSPLEPSNLATSLAASGLVVLAVSVGITLWGVAHHVHPPTRPRHLPGPVA